MWPGVLSAGCGQALLLRSRIRPDGRPSAAVIRIFRVFSFFFITYTIIFTTLACYPQNPVMFGLDFIAPAAV